MRVPDGSSADGAAASVHFEAGLVRAAPMLVIALRPDGELAYASPGSLDVIGYTPDELVGTNVLDYVHPDDRDRAALTMMWRDDDGMPAPGVSRFVAHHKQLGYVNFETTASHVTLDGLDSLVLYIRPGSVQMVAEDVLSTIVRGAPRAEALNAVLEAVSWAEHGSRVAIAWAEPEGWAHVSTGLAEALSGTRAEGEGTPWARCVATRGPVRCSADDLDDETRSVASTARLSELWVEPVLWSDAEPPALLSLWSVGGVHQPEIHGYGMRVARDFTELIMRFTTQTRLLEEMATHDPLTGLANRRVFFERVAQATAGGAVLYCDLDHFKPVNDEMGHTAGDHLLQAVAGRLLGCLRRHDVIARIGGDEFGVLCERASRDEASAAAARLQEAFVPHFDLDGKQVVIGVTIGIGHSPEALGAEVIDRADRALRAAKLGQRGSVLADWEAEPSI
jgi:diguanylate cyclase (GGDEF)-like protein/PAS domain S-box-containing protein